MRELSPQAAIEQVLDRGLCRSQDHTRARMLTGGVSSNVVLVETDDPLQRWVLKQPCPKLKVTQDWQCGVERVWREVEVLEICGHLLSRDVPAGGEPSISVPQVLFTDRENFLYAMTAATPGSKPWKELLLRGAFDERTAEMCGQMLGQLHGQSWQDASIAERLDDREFFVKLRLEPYYGRVAEVHSGRSEIQELMQSVWENRCCLVHGDFSPKNLLVSPGQVMLIDFEVGHYGDPAFDLGFFLTHLVCKQVRLRSKTLFGGLSGGCQSPLSLADLFWAVYRETLIRCLAERSLLSESACSSLAERAMKNLGGCLLARVDGKSPLEYLATAEERDQVRQLGWKLLDTSPIDWTEARELIADSFKSR